MREELRDLLNYCKTGKVSDNLEWEDKVNWSNITTIYLIDAIDNLTSAIKQSKVCKKINQNKSMDGFDLPKEKEND